MEDDKAFEAEMVAKIDRICVETALTASALSGKSPSHLHVQSLRYCWNLPKEATDLQLAKKRWGALIKMGQSAYLEREVARLWPI